MIHFEFSLFLKLDNVLDGRIARRTAQLSKKRTLRPIYSFSSSQCGYARRLIEECSVAKVSLNEKHYVW